MRILDPFNDFPHAVGPIIPVRTSAGIIYRQVLIGAARLLDANGHGYPGGWFLELFGVEADIPKLDVNDQLVVGSVGNVEFEGSGLTGENSIVVSLKVPGNRQIV